MTDVEKFFKEWGSVCRMLTKKDNAIYSHKELLDFAEAYHQSKVNNSVLDVVNGLFPSKSGVENIIEASYTNKYGTNYDENSLKSAKDGAMIITNWLMNNR